MDRLDGPIGGKQQANEQNNRDRQQHTHTQLPSHPAGKVMMAS